MKCCGEKGTLSVERKKGGKEELREWSTGFAQKENLSGLTTREQEVLNVAGFFVLFFANSV